jgi:hypothetical protein
VKAERNPERIVTLAQLSTLKAWMVAHRARHPLEYHAWDAVLTLWLMGWMGVPACVLLDDPWAVMACVALFFTPPGYLRLRGKLHRQRRLRCDWLEVIQPARPRG